MYLWSFYTHLFSCQHCLWLRARNPGSAGIQGSSAAAVFLPFISAKACQKQHTPSETSQLAPAANICWSTNNANQRSSHLGDFQAGSAEQMCRTDSVFQMYCHFRLLWGLDGADRHGTGPEGVSLLSGGQTGYIRAPLTPLDNTVRDMNPTWESTRVYAGEISRICWLNFHWLWWDRSHGAHKYRYVDTWVQVP